MVVKTTVIFIIIFVATVQEINYKAGGGGGLKIDTDVCVVPFLESPARIDNQFFKTSPLFNKS